MLLTPFSPMPHVWEKLMMLKEGALSRPLDIFDLFFHLAQSLLLIVKIYRTAIKKSKPGGQTNRPNRPPGP
jgi:hypothetical protein